MQSSETRFNVDVCLGKMQDGRELLLHWKPPIEDNDSKNFVDILNMDK